MSATDSNALTGLVSIHDTMPETLPQVRDLISQLRSHGVDKLTLLVVPGKEWTERDLQQLREWQDAGIHLAGHGWNHLAKPPRSLYHKLHSLFLSRMAAEHLSLTRQQITLLIEECYCWFEQRDFTPPTLYVPPAWALGALPARDLSSLPFRTVELLSGVVESRSTTLKRLPLTGYEADTALRAFSLGYWNKWNAWRARAKNLPLRIGIHPFDDSLRLREQMHEQLQACKQFITYDELFASR